jgi:MFS family permease
MASVGLAKDDATPGAREALNLRGSWLLSLLFLTAVINMFDRQVINILAEEIKAEFHLSDGQLGLLTGSAFGLLYAVVSVPLARIADRHNRVHLISAAIGVWSVFTIICGATTGFIQLFLARMGVGVGEAGSQPASTALIHDVIPARFRASALSLVMGGQPVGKFLGFLVGGLLAGSYGWRIAFVFAGVPGAVLAVTMFLTLRDPRAAKAFPKPDIPPFLKTLLILYRTPGMVPTTLGLICSAFLIVVTNAWVPLMLKRVHGLSIEATGAYSAVIVGVGGAIGAFGSGVLCDVLRPRIRAIETKMLIATVGMCTPLLLLTAFAPNLYASLGFAFLLNIFAYAWQAPLVCNMQRMSGAESRALGLGAAMSISAITSSVIGLPLVGFISDFFHPTAGTGSDAWADAAASAATSEPSDRREPIGPSRDNVGGAQEIEKNSKSRR